MGQRPNIHHLTLLATAPIFVGSIVEVDVVKVSVPALDRVAVGHVVRDVASGSVFSDSMARARRALESASGPARELDSPVLQLLRRFRGRVLDTVLDSVRECPFSEGWAETSMQIEVLEELPTWF